MSRPRRCPQCGGEIQAGAPSGICAECLLGLALQPEAMDPRPAQARPLPRSLLLDGLRRMSWVGGALALSAAGVYLAGSYIQPGWVNPATAAASYTVAIWGIAVSGLLLFALPKFPWRDPAAPLDAGLVLQAVAGLLISISENSIPYTTTEPIRSMSSVAIWITAFALAVPASYGKALVAALATAAMGPIGLGIQILLGNVPQPAPALWLVISAPTFLMAAGSTLLGKLIYKLGTEVKEAREYGGYRLVSRLGSGGMGEVWRARHHLVDREAAVKLIRPDLFLARPDDRLAAIRRFEREARATAALRSPHTVSLYDYGLSEDGILYYVMELLAGYDLEALVRKCGPLPAARTVHILLQVCDSLAEAHAAGLVHRDIKAGNILLSPLGTHSDFAKVLDFGLVGLTDSMGSGMSTQVAGTPAYMAPEILQGKGGDARSDIYSLGCVAYWLLCGKPVFEANSTPLLMQAHLNETPAALSTRTPGPIPVELESLIMDCLAKNPASRPSSAIELAARLRTIAADLPWSRAEAERCGVKIPAPCCNNRLSILIVQIPGHGKPGTSRRFE